MKKVAGGPSREECCISSFSKMDQVKLLENILAAEVATSISCKCNRNQFKDEEIGSARKNQERFRDAFCEKTRQEGHVRP